MSPRVRRSDPRVAGIRRRRAGRGFVYLDPGASPVRDPAMLERIRSLAVPPAWTDVWICPDPLGHIQAVGFDAKGRRQYRYHDLWRQERDRQKFDHMLEVATALPRIRRIGDLHLAEEGLGQDKVLATAVRLLDIGFFRVGGEQYAEENGSYGLATLLRRHARVKGDEVIFDYPAKSGRERVQSIADAQVRAVVAALKGRRGGGPELLAYREGRRWVDVTSTDINAYLRRVSGLEITAKDFRTWNATVLAAVGLAVSWQARASRRSQERAIRRVVCEVSEYLGNTPTVCRTSYIDPRVVDLFRDGVTIRPALDRIGQKARPGGLGVQGEIEKATLSMLRRSLPGPTRKPAAATSVTRGRAGATSAPRRTSPPANGRRAA